MSEVSVRYKAIATSSKTDCHNTPNQIIEATLECFGGAIALDPCSNSHECPNVPATQLYTIEDDGLSRDWVATSMYLNPPYSDTAAWADKLIGHVKSGDVREAIALVKSDNRTRWYADLMDACDGFCLYRGYLKFGEAASSAPFASAIFYFGNNFDNFDRAFSDLGWVFPRRSPAISQQERLLMQIGGQEFLQHMLNGGEYSAVDERAIALASNLEAHRHELESVGIHLSYGDSPVHAIGSLLRWHKFKVTGHQARVNGERIWIYRIDTATQKFCDTAISLKKGNDLQNPSEQEIKLSQKFCDSEKDSEGEFLNRILRAGDRAEIFVEEGLTIPVKIIAVLPDGQHSCQDLAGRWRKPLSYTGSELQTLEVSDE